MNKQLIQMAACGVALMSAVSLKAQGTVTTVVGETAVTPVKVAECKNHYYSSSWRDNWFIQLGAGIRSPFVENYSDSRRVTAIYSLGVGRWMSPYTGFRFSAYYGAMHWNSGTTARARTANANVDFMWDMFNSIGGYNPGRVFSMVPYIGLGGTYVYRYRPEGFGNIDGDHGHRRHSQWMFPVSAGLQLRVRLCDYADFFAEGRAMVYGDNFNNVAYDKSMDIDISAIGGFTFYFTGSGFVNSNSCDYISALDMANDRINSLRGELAATGAALAAAEAQLPCPDVQATVQEVVVDGPVVFPTVRFRLNSAYVSSQEMVNVYNVAEYLKANPGTQIVVRGYADRDTGSSAYNKKLSERRARAVADILTGDYGIEADRLVLEAAGSDEQPYQTNSWNRIVIFAVPE